MRSELLRKVHRKEGFRRNMIDLIQQRLLLSSQLISQHRRGMTPHIYTLTRSLPVITVYFAIAAQNKQ